MFNIVFCLDFSLKRFSLFFFVMLEDYYFGDPLRIALLKIFLDLLMKFSLRIIFSY